MAIQAPATANYCSNFIHAANSLLLDARTRDAFQGFRSPWVFLETSDAYANVFLRSGFSIASSEIKRVTQHCTPEKAREMFESGAAAGYLNPECYDVALPPDFIETAREVILRDFQAQAGATGQMELTFSRIYLLARKP